MFFILEIVFTIIVGLILLGIIKAILGWILMLIIEHIVTIGF